MFSNKVIRSICSPWEENNLRLSEADWKKVLSANKCFSENQKEWRGSATWGKYLINKISKTYKRIDFNSSLELCCGNGFLYFSFNKIFNIKNDNYFIDISKSQCFAMRERCIDYNAKVPGIIIGDIGALPFKKGKLKLVYGNSFLHHVPDVGFYLKEINKVLAPGGKLIVFHEPTPTANFFESFPVSFWRRLWRRNLIGPLTDIWLINTEIINILLKEGGFKTIEILPNGLLSSIFIIPLEKLACNRLGLRLFQSLFIYGRILFDRIESFLPLFLRRKWSPSIAIVAQK